MKRGETGNRFPAHFFTAFVGADRPAARTQPPRSILSRRGSTSSAMQVGPMLWLNRLLPWRGRVHQRDPKIELAELLANVFRGVAVAGDDQNLFLWSHVQPVGGQ